jgi:hypothetical protein
MTNGNGIGDSFLRYEGSDHAAQRGVPSPPQRRRGERALERSLHLSTFNSRRSFTMTSTLDPDNFPLERKRKTQKGHDARSLGPSDSSDTGSDMTGIGNLDDTTDRNLTGERTSVGTERAVRPGTDIETDRVVGPDEAGIEYGPEEAEENDRGLH